MPEEEPTIVREYWEYNGFSLTDETNGYWDVEGVLEGTGIPELRGDDIVVPSAHGRQWVAKKYDRRKVILAMWIRGTDRKVLDANIDTFTQGVYARGVHPLKRTMRDESVRVAYGELRGPLNFVTKNPGVTKFAFEVELADPFFYGAEDVVAETTLSTSPKTWDHVDTSTAPVSYMTITLEGPLKNPKLTNVTNGVWVQYTGTLGVGDTVVLDTEKFTCLLNGANAVGNVTHGGDARWFVLDAATSELKAETETTGGTVTLTYKPTFF